MVVVIGLTVINSVVEYVLQPMFMKKGLDLSFLEVTLSLMVWGFILGPWGAVLAIPLTLSLRKFIDGFSKEEAVMPASARGPVQRSGDLWTRMKKPRCACSDRDSFQCGLQRDVSKEAGPNEFCLLSGGGRHEPRFVQPWPHTHPVKAKLTMGAFISL